MATNIGPRIGIDGEADYRNKINNIIQQARTLRSEMKMVTAGFDENTTAQDRVAAQSAVLAKQIEVQRDRVNALTDMLDRASAKYDANDTSVLKWQEAVNEATAELRKMERELEELPDELEEFSDAAEDAGDSTFSFGDALKAGGIIEAAKAIASAIGDIIESTKEYRKIMASLEVSSERAGYSAHETAASYQRLYGVLGDEQGAATATANLQALGLTQDQLISMIDGTIGAWSEYGDSIPIESLTEAINETSKVGKVTGVFADVLNWAGKSEDEFNAKLAAAGSQAERTNLILEELANQGLMDAGKAWQENNKSLVDANLAADQMNQVYARIAEMAAPAVNTLAMSAATLAMYMLDMIESGSPLVGVFTGAAASAVALAVALNMSTIITTAKTALDAARTSVLALNAAMSANPVGVVIALLVGLGTALVTLYNTNEEFREGVIAVWEGLQETVSLVVDEFVTFFTVDIPNAADATLGFFEENWQTIEGFLTNPFVAGFQLLYDNFDWFAEAVDGMRENAVEAYEEMKEGISERVDEIKSSVVDGMEEAVDYIKDLPGKAKTWGKDMIQGFIDGMKSKFGSLSSASSAAASEAHAYLHFSVPDKGPLADADEYGGDFMELIASGIRGNIGLLRSAADQAALAMVVNPQTAVVGGSSSTVTTFGPIEIHVHGSEGQSVSELADAVMDRMQIIFNQKEVAFVG